MYNEQQLEPIEIQCEAFMEKHDISYNDLTDELKELYDALDDALNDYESIDDDADETQARDLLITIEAKDNGLLSKLEPFQKELEEKRKQIIQSQPTLVNPTTPPTNENGENKVGENNDNPNGDEMGDGGQAKSYSRPSWRFW